MPTADPPDTAADPRAAGLPWRPAPPGGGGGGAAGTFADWPPVLAGRPLAFLRQVHGAGVAEVGPLVPGHGPPEALPPVAEADVLVTASAGPVLLALTADCVPVL